MFSPTPPTSPSSVDSCPQGPLPCPTLPHTPYYSHLLLPIKPLDLPGTCLCLFHRLTPSQQVCLEYSWLEVHVLCTLQKKNGIRAPPSLGIFLPPFSPTFDSTIFLDFLRLLSHLMIAEVHCLFMSLSYYILCWIIDKGLAQRWLLFWKIWTTSLEKRFIDFHNSTIERLDCPPKPTY